MQYSQLTVEELQRLTLSGDDKAAMELGKRAAHIDFCFQENHDRYCKHLHALRELEMELDNEPPPELYEQGFNAGLIAGRELNFYFIVREWYYLSFRPFVRGLFWALARALH